MTKAGNNKTAVPPTNNKAANGKSPNNAAPAKASPNGKPAAKTPAPAPAKAKASEPVPTPAQVEVKAEPQPTETGERPNENQLREEGNAAFKTGQYKKASKLYSEAIELIQEVALGTLTPNGDSPEFINLMKTNECLSKSYNNRTQCFLFEEKWQKAVDDATKILHAIPEDTKALYRRSQGYQGLQKFAEALRDAQLLVKIEPKNNTFIDYIQKLNRKIQDVAQEQQSTKSQTKKMLELAVDKTLETKVTALNNLIVLTREDAGSQAIIASGGLQTMVELLTTEQKPEVTLAVARILASLCKNSAKRSKTVFNQVQYELIAGLISYDDHDISTAAALIIQNMLLSLTDLTNKRKHIKKHVQQPIEFTPEIQEYVDEIFRAIIMLIMDPKCSGYGRDNCIDLCLKYVDRANGCAWTPRFIVFGVPKLLRVASTIPELKLPNSLPLTENTKMHVSCCLGAIYDDIYHDGEREKYNEVCENFVKEHIANDQDPHGKLKGIAALGTILQGPFEVGSAIIVKNGLINMMLDLADSDDMVQEVS